jgi:hypothetical protein
MSWHNDDDEVENDSVGWFNARDYEQAEQPTGFYGNEPKKAQDDRNDPFAWMRQPGAFGSDG